MATNNGWNSQNPVQPAMGGTSLSTLTSNALLVGNSTSAVALVGPGTNGQVVLSGGAAADPAFVTPTAGTGVSVTTNSTTLSYASTLSTPVTAANGGLGAASFTAYSVITAGTTSTGNFQNVSGLGSSGNVLTSSGASALPVWGAAPAVQSWVLIQTQSIAGTVSFTGLSTTYFVYMVVLSNIQSTGGTLNYRMRYSTDGGSSYLSTNYQCGINSTSYNSTTTTNTNSTSECLLVSSNLLGSSAPTYNAVLYLWGMESAVNPVTFGYYSCLNGSSNFEQGYISATNTSTTAVNAIRFTSFGGAGGSLNTGTISLYGILK